MENNKDKGYVWLPYITKTVSTSINGETVWYANKWKNLLLKIKHFFIKPKYPDYPTRAEQLREQGWLEIDKAFSKYWTEYTDGDFSHFTAVEKAQRKIGWLKENYNPPTKKQDRRIT